MQGTSICFMISDDTFWRLQTLTIMYWTVSVSPCRDGAVPDIILIAKWPFEIPFHSGLAAALKVIKQFKISPSIRVKFCNIGRVSTITECNHQYIGAHCLFQRSAAVIDYCYIAINPIMVIGEMKCLTRDASANRDGCSNKLWRLY